MPVQWQKIAPIPENKSTGQMELSSGKRDNYCKIYLTPSAPTPP